MFYLLALFLIFWQTGAGSLPATDVKAAAIQATVKEEIAKNITDLPIRVVDAGGYHVGVGVVHRDTKNEGHSAVHDKVTEVYQMLEGSGTLVTGGTMINPQRRASDNSVVTGINGPGISGDGIKGGVTRKIEKGDVVVIPAGTPHYWTSIDKEMAYTVIRIDPQKVVALK